MLTVCSDEHRLHSPKFELFNGEFVEPVEKPERVEHVLRRLKAVSLGEIVAAQEFGDGPLLRVHAPRYVAYLQDAWAEWSALGRTHDVLPFCFPVPGMRRVEPQHIDGRAGFFAFDTGAPISEHTWRAVKGSANCAVTAQRHIAAGARAAFALCRPPGHHAGTEIAGGYCYINNAAVAAHAFIDGGAQRVAILDVDYHHGNGTQQIFYRHGNVLFASIHADPAVEFPYFLGYADELGEGPGEGCNHNYPLSKGIQYREWSVAMTDACARIARYSPDALVVSLGVDTFENDPISRFKLKSEDYLRIGEVIGRLDLPTLFVLEGGYALEQFGTNVVNTLQGFESAAAR